MGMLVDYSVHKYMLAEYANLPERIFTINGDSLKLNWRKTLSKGFIDSSGLNFCTLDPIKVTVDCTSFSFRSNLICYLDEHLLTRFDKLNYLDLSSNFIEFTQDRPFQYLKQLDTLNLSGNMLKKIIPSFFQGT